MTQFFTKTSAIIVCNSTGSWLITKTNIKTNLAWVLPQIYIDIGKAREKHRNGGKPIRTLIHMDWDRVYETNSILRIEDEYVRPRSWLINMGAMDKQMGLIYLMRCMYLAYPENCYCAETINV